MSQACSTGPDLTRISFSVGRELNTEQGSCWLIESPLEELRSSLGTRTTTGARANGSGTIVVDPMSDRFRACHPQATLFFDLETCGLAGAAVFLIGVICPSPQGLVLRQYWSRHYAEEAAILTAFADEWTRCRLLVSFNGKSFDWPQMHDRLLVHGLSRIRGMTQALSLPLMHWDLLHTARRQWKSRLPNCKLQTLEEWICRRRRESDVPGHQIPEMYRQYVSSGDPQLVDPILRHNALDLMTLVELALHLTHDDA